MTVIKLQYTIKHFEDGTVCINGTKEEPGGTTNSENIHTLSIPKNGNEILEPIKLGLSLQNITSLLIPHCNLPHLPNELEFCNLTELDLSYNLFIQVPNFVITKNENLQKLNMSHNQLRDFNFEPKCCKNLRYLNLKYNSISDIPNWIFTSTSLETLDISENPLNTLVLRSSGYSLIKLRFLEMNNSNIKSYCNFMHEIPNLVKLSISNLNKKNYLNTIQELPFSLFKSSKTMTELHLSGLGFPYLSEEITKLSALEILGLSCNHLTWLPNNFTELKSLKILDLSQNALLYLPSDIGELENLEELHLSNNLIGSLPESLVNLQKIKILDLYCNDLIETSLIIVNKIMSLIAFDIEQNSFAMNDEENYLKLRKRMWDLKKNRFTGCKLVEISDNESRHYSSVDSNSDSDSQEENIDISNHEEENWDCDNIDAIYDDSMLVLPPYKFRTVRRPSIYNPSDHINPIYFEDALYDDT